MQPQRQSHIIFALLMAALLLLPLLGLFAPPAAGQPLQYNLYSIGSHTEETAPGEDAVASSMEDAWRAGLIRGAYIFNSHLNSFDIDTQVDGTQATLRGVVANQSQRELAEQIALSIDGVDAIINEISISTESNTGGAEQIPPVSFTDAAVTTKVKSQLLANTQTSGLAIDVITENQVVTLIGLVDNDVERELAYYITRNTGGVRQVVNKLQVRPQV